jgi:lipid biosynthesis B12-binding/radical SAM protein
MRITLIYPSWPKLPRQVSFHLPPHGPIVFAAELEPDIELRFCDEHVQEIDYDDRPDLIAISAMLTCQMPHAWEIADRFRAQGVPVIFGGIGANLHAEQTARHADAVFLGEIEGHWAEIRRDFEAGKLAGVYDRRHQLPDTRLVRPARREILDRARYRFRGVQMVDLIHASRGCRFDCFPCCTPYLGGRRFRPRPIDDVVRELEGIDNNRLFFVDNSLAQDDQWEKDLFRAIKPLKKKWISHPIKDNDEILDLAAEAGCWYVYQAVAGVTDGIRRRIRRLKERGIGVEGTIILGLDDQDEDSIKRLVDFLLEVELDMAEFTILTPFPHTPIRATLAQQGRILHDDWAHYTAGEVVYQPALMTPDQLQKAYEYAWDTFYQDAGQELKMARLFMKVIQKERADGTYVRTRLSPERNWRSAAGPTPLKVLLVSSNTALHPYPAYPLGMAMVAAALERAGHEVRQFDMLQQGESLERFRETVRDWDPGLIGVSIRNVDNTNLLKEQRFIGTAQELVSAAREVSKAPIVLGGSGFSLLPEEILAATGADYGIVGEGEQAIVNLAARLAQRDAPAKRCIRTNIRLRDRQIAPARYDPEILRYYMENGSITPVQTKRGCSCRCAYCSYPALEGTAVRPRDPGEVCDEIARLKDELSVPFIFFSDSVFNDEQGHYITLVREMCRRKLHIRWTAFFRPARFEEEIIELMKTSGLTAVELGTDAATDTTLEALHKPFRFADVVACNDQLLEHGVSRAHYVMFGGPGETQETVREGIANVLSLRHTVVFVFMGIRILPGTHLLRIAEAEGLIERGQPLLEPAYYLSPSVDRDWLERTLTEAFAGNRQVVFPPDRFDVGLRLLHKFGHSGMLWDLLLRPARKSRGGAPLP